MITFSRLKIGLITISLLTAAMVWAPFTEAAPKVKPSDPTDNSDLNNDKTVDYNDLIIFSLEYLGQNVDAVDWCAFYAATGGDDDLYGRPPSYYTKHFSQLLTFINDGLCNLGDISDLNEDGRTEVAVGAPMDDDGGSSPNANRGALWVLNTRKNTLRSGTEM